MVGEAVWLQKLLLAKYDDYFYFKIQVVNFKILGLNLSTVTEGIAIPLKVQRLSPSSLDLHFLYALGVCRVIGSIWNLMV